MFGEKGFVPVQEHDTLVNHHRGCISLSASGREQRAVIDWSDVWITNVS